jgi:ABC-type glutathione transport system ATPase component
LGHVRPVYPSFWINVGIVSLILFGYLTWGVIFVQLVALRFRFFKQLRAFQHEIDAPQSKLAAGFEATRNPRDVWLGRLLYASQDSVQAGAPALDQAESAEEGDESADDGAARQRAMELLEYLGVAQRADNLPDALSGGEQQRVAVARALANQPSLILADEPTAALDRQRGRQVMELFAKVAHEQHAAVVVVTHDTRALDLFDRILEMEDGRLKPDEPHFR